MPCRYSSKSIEAAVVIQLTGILALHRDMVADAPMIREGGTGSLLGMGIALGFFDHGRSPPLARTVGRSGHLMDGRPWGYPLP